MIRRLMCKLGFHSLFKQHDSWGSGYCCRYCLYSRQEY